MDWRWKLHLVLFGRRVWVNWVEDRGKDVKFSCLSERMQISVGIVTDSGAAVVQTSSNVHTGWNRCCSRSQPHSEHWSDAQNSFHELPIHHSVTQGAHVQQCQCPLQSGIQWWSLRCKENWKQAAQEINTLFAVTAVVYVGLAQIFYRRRESIILSFRDVLRVLLLEILSRTRLWSFWTNRFNSPILSCFKRGVGIHWTVKRCSWVLCGICGLVCWRRSNII